MSERTNGNMRRQTGDDQAQERLPAPGALSEVAGYSVLENQG